MYSASLPSTPWAQPWARSAAQKIKKLSESPATAPVVAKLCVINSKNRFGSRLHQQQPIMCWCIPLPPPGSVGEGFQEATLFLEPRFFMESTHPALLNIGEKVEQSVREEKSGTSFTFGKFFAEFLSTLFLISIFLRGFFEFFEFAISNYT